MTKRAGRRRKGLNKEGESEENGGERGGGETDRQTRTDTERRVREKGGGSKTGGEGGVTDEEYELINSLKAGGQMDSARTQRTCLVKLGLN